MTSVCADVSQLPRLARECGAMVFEARRAEETPVAGAAYGHEGPQAIPSAAGGSGKEEDTQQPEREAASAASCKKARAAAANMSGCNRQEEEEEEAAMRRLMEVVDEQLEEVELSRIRLQRDILLGTRVPQLLAAHARARERERAMRERAATRSQGGGGGPFQVAGGEGGGGERLIKSLAGNAGRIRRIMRRQCDHRCYHDVGVCERARRAGAGVEGEVQL